MTPAKKAVDDPEDSKEDEGGEKFGDEGEDIDDNVLDRALRPDGDHVENVLNREPPAVEDLEHAVFGDLDDGRGGEGAPS